ncbi:MAG: hypothetical protein KGI26_04800 [Thaumarchaeota archaeon]|nr:hypothetical protein [Nitrososphaerota archaeon]
MTQEGQSAKAEPRLAKRLKRGIADGVLDYNGREETLGVWMTKAYWKELLAVLEASAPPAAERTALKALRGLVEANLYDLRTSLQEYSTKNRKLKMERAIQENEWFLSKIDAQERAGEP